MLHLDDISFAGGNSSFSNKGPKGSFKHGANLDIRKSVDSLSCGQTLKEEGLLGISFSQSASNSPSGSTSPSPSGSPSVSPSGSPSTSLSPSGSPSKSSSASLSPSGSASPSSSVSPSPSPSAGLFNVFEDIIYFFVKCTDGNTYGFGNTGYIYRRTPDSHWVIAYKDPDGGIKGAVEKPSSGKTYLQWATNTKIMRKEIPGNSNWTDVEIINTNLNSADWHTMKQVGGSNIICNGPWLAMVGYDDSYTNEALDLIPGNVSKCIVERNGRAVIGTVKAWDLNRGVNAMIDTEVPLSQVGNDGELFFANFTDTMPAKRFPGGGKVNPGGVANEVDQVSIFDWEQTSLSWIDKQDLGNMSLWGVWGANTDRNGVYTYGRKNKEQPFTLNLEYALEVDEIGAVVNVEGVTLISYRDGSDFGVKAVDSENKAVGSWESLEWKVPKKTPESPTVWKYAEVEMAPLPSGCSVAFYYKMDKNGDFIKAKVADGSDEFTYTDGIEAVFRIGAKGKIYERKLVLTPYLNTTPEIFSVSSFFV
jgi:hypothetical protein